MMFNFGPSNLASMLSRFGGQNAGFWNPRAPKLDPSTGQYNTPTGPMLSPVGPSSGVKFGSMNMGQRQDPFRPRMPRIQPDTPTSNYSPISPNRGVFDRFLSMGRY